MPGVCEWLIGKMQISCSWPRSIVKAFEQLLRTKKESIPQKKFEPMSLKQYYSEIDEAMKDSENNRVLSTNQLLEKIKEWK